MRRKAISRTALWAIVAIVVIVVVVGGVAAYYATRPPPPKPAPTPTPTHAIVGQVTIAFEDSLTGSLGPIGEEALWSAQLAVSQINQQGGIYLANGPNGPGNYTINLVWGDDQSSPANGPTTTAQLITAYHPAAMILTPASAVAVPDEAVIEQYGIPAMGICLTDLLTLNSQYTSGNPKAYMVFHYQPTGLQQGAMVAEFIEDVVKPAISPNKPLRVVYIGQDTDMGHSFFMGYNLSVYGNGWQNDQEIVDVIWYPAGTTSFQSIISRIVMDEPNVIVEGTWPNEMAAFLQQAAEAPALKGVIQIGNAIDDDISTYGPAGPAANGWFTPTGFPEFSPAANATVNAKWTAFRQDLEAYGHVRADSPAAAAYDVTWILAYAIHDAGSTNSTAIINALETMPPPPQLLMLTVPTSQGTLFSNSLPTKFSPVIREYHTATFEPIVVEAFWNSTSQSVTSEIVWPPNLAVTSPVFTGTP